MCARKRKEKKKGGGGVLLCVRLPTKDIMHAAMIIAAGMMYFVGTQVTL